MRVHPSVSILLCLFVLHSCYAFNPPFDPFFNLHRNLFTLRHTIDDSSEDSWPFAVDSVDSRKKVDTAVDSSEASDIFREQTQRDTEPLDLDFVKGPITDPDDTNVDVIKEPTPTIHTGNPEFSDESDFHSISSSFNTHFGNIFGHNVFSHNFNPFTGFGLFDLPRYQPWWKGPNVCTTREEDVEDEVEANENDRSDKISGEVEVKDDSLIQAFHLNLESCVEKPNKYQCRKITNHAGKKRTFTVTHKCCQGFGRSRSSNQCEKLNLAPLENTIEELGAKEFMQAAKKSLNVAEMDGMTVFAPMDANFHDFSERMFDNNLVVVPLSKRERRDTNYAMSGEDNSVNSDLFRAHMVKGLIDVQDIENEQLLTTEYKNTSIRLNIFPRPPSDRSYEYPYQYTANCVPIVKPNQLASNGMVHMIKGVLVPPEKTVMQMLKEREDMAVLATILERTKLDEMLNDPTKHVTVFAPTDRAFEKLEPHLRKQLKEGRGCAQNVLRNHILDLTLCSSAVAPDAKTSAFNLLSEKLEMEMIDGAKRRQDNEIADMINEQEIMINGQAHIIEPDLMGTNGVIHVIDAILPTDSAQPVTTTMNKHNSTIMSRLLEASELSDYVDDSMNMTFFAPTDKAFEQSEAGQQWIKMLDENPDQLKNNEQFKRFVDYHMVQPMIKTCDLNDGMVKTRAERDLRVNLYSTNFPFMNIMNRATVNCARLVHFDEDSCGSVVHQIDKVLEAPSMTLLQQLESNEKYSTFLRLVREANLTELLSDDTKGLTLLVPNDELFKEVDDYLTELKEKDGLEYLIKSHIVPDVLCCAGISQSQWPFVRSIEALSHAHLHLNRDRRPKVQNAGITKCDITATNGIIHEVNDLINVKPRQSQYPEHHFRHELFF